MQKLSYFKCKREREQSNNHDGDEREGGRRQ